MRTIAAIVGHLPPAARAVGAVLGLSVVITGCAEIVLGVRFLMRRRRYRATREEIRRTLVRRYGR
jgi:hypothetical protein